MHPRFPPRSPHALALRSGLALLAALGLACSSGIGRPVRSVSAVAGSDGVQRVEVRLHSFYFEPNRIVVRAGRPVELELRNRSLFVPHNLTIADSAISVSQAVGRRRTHTIRFTPLTPGEFEFFCHVGSHAKKGMKGILVVEP